MNAYSEFAMHLVSRKRQDRALRNRNYVASIEMRTFVGTAISVHHLNSWGCKLATKACIYWRVLLTAAVVSLVFFGDPVLALPKDPAWGNRQGDDAFALQNRRGPNPIYAVTPINPNIGSPEGRLEADGGSVTGNYHLSIPLITLPGRGLNLSVTAQYNSQIWSQLSAKGELMFDYGLDGDWPVAGWNFGFGKLVFPNDAMFIEPGGSRHSIPKVIYEWKDGKYTGRVTGQFVDGSGGSVECLVGSNGCNVSPYRAYVSLESGLKMEMLSVTSGNVDSRVYYPQKIFDSNGNFIQITYRNDSAGQPSPPNIDHITDTVGRVIQFHYDARGLPIAISGPGLGGGRRVFARFYYHQFNSTVSVPLVGSQLKKQLSVQFPVLDAVLFTGNKTGYVFTDFTPFGIPKKVSVNRQMTWTTDSLTDQGSYSSGLITRSSAFDYPDNANYLTGKSLPVYSQRIDTWADPITKSLQQSTTTFSGSSDYSSVVLPDGSSSVQAIITADPGNWDYGLADWTRTIASDGKWLSTVHYLWEQGETVANYIVPRLKEVQVENHEINAVQRTEFRYGINNRQVIEEIRHAYAPPENLDAAPIISRTVRQYLGQPEYIVNGFNLVTQLSVFESGLSPNPAYLRWQQELGQLKQIMDQAAANAVPLQQAVDAAQAAYDAEVANEPDPFIDNGHGVKKQNPDYVKWKGAMASLKAQLDAAKENAIPTQQALLAAQANYNSLAGSAPPQTVAHEMERTNFEYDIPNLQALSPQPINFSPNRDPFAARGLISKVTRWLAPDAKAIYEANDGLRPITTNYIHDEAGNLREVRSGASGVTQYVYGFDTQFSLADSVITGSTDPSSQSRRILRMSYDLGTGLELTSTDANHQVRKTTYRPAASGWRVGNMTLPTGVIAAYTYVDKYLLVETSLKDAEGRRYVQSSHFDGRGLVRRLETLRHSNGAHDVEEFRYDAMGRTVQSLSVKRTSDHLPERWTQFFYDPAGRVSRVKDPSGSLYSWFYNEREYVALAHGQLGESVRTVDPWGRESWGLSDSQGHPLTRVLCDPTSGKVADSGSVSVDYQYDVLSRLLQVRQYSLNGAFIPQVRSYHYDSIGRLTGTSVPERDTTLDVHGEYHATSGQYSDIYAYDDLSNLIQHVDPRGVRTNFRFNDDALNRLQSIDYDLSGIGDESSPIAAVPPTTYSYVPASMGDPLRIQSITTDRVLNVRLGYDSYGRQNSTAWSFLGLETSGWKLNTEAHYDSLGRPVKVNFPARYKGNQFQTGLSLDYRYSIDGDLAEMDLDGAALVRNVDNGVLGRRHMDLFSNGVKIGEDNLFDPISGRITQQSVSGPGPEKLLQLDYAYRDTSHIAEAGQILLQNDLLDVKQRRRIEYDAWGRLQASYMGPEPATADTVRQEYRYDAFGNRIGSTGSRFAPELNTWVRWESLSDGIAPEVSATSNRIQQSGYLWDRAGNLIQRPDEVAGGTHHYIYDAAERLVRVENGSGELIESYLYGADRRRIGTSHNMADWRISLWNGYSEMARYDHHSSEGTLDWLDMPIYLGERLLAEVSQQSGNGPAVSIFHSDQRGIALKTTVSTAGVLTATRRSTRPFGAENANDATVDDERLFTTYRRSTRTGLDYAMNRFYDFRLGRFIQPDPIFSGLNLYTFGDSDPINHTDPLGLFWKNECKKTGETDDGDIIECTATWIQDQAPPPQGGGTWSLPGGYSGGDSGGPGLVDIADKVKCVTSHIGTNDLRGLANAILHIPHDAFGFVGAEKETKFPFLNVHVGQADEGLIVFGHNSTNGFSVEGLGARGYSVEGTVLGEDAYVGIFGAVAVPIWSQEEGGFPHHPTPGILVEGAIGNAFAGSYRYGSLLSNDLDRGVYFGARLGPAFAGAGFSFDSLHFQERALKLAAIATLAKLNSAYHDCNK